MSNQQFSLRDCVMLAVVGLILAVGLIGCGGTSNGQKMDNGKHIRMIQQACVLFSQSNKEYYPGRTTDGRVIDTDLKALPGKYGAAAPTNANQSMAYALLLNGEFFPPKALIAPGESGGKTAAPDDDTAFTITNANYSHALLQFSNKDGDMGRRLEWRDTNNSQAPIVADRSKLIDPALNTTSIHGGDATGNSNQWQGSIGWNDNHVTFETSAVFVAGKIKYGSIHNNAVDDLFIATDGAGPDKNAMFAY